MSALDEATVPVLPRGVRLKEDTARDRHVLLAPERVIALDAIGVAILSEVDGEQSFGEIVGTLAERYAAPRDRIAGDAGKFLAALMDRRLVSAR